MYCMDRLGPFKCDMLHVSKQRQLVSAMALERVHQAAQLEFALLIRDHCASSVVAFVVDYLESPDLQGYS